MPIRSKPSEQLKTTQTRPNSLLVIYLDVSVLPDPAGPEAAENLNIAYDYDIVTYIFIVKGVITKRYVLPKYSKA